MSEAGPARSTRGGRWLRSLTVSHLGVLASFVAVAISLWSTQLSYETQQAQEEQSRRSQANQVLLFDASPLFLAEDTPPTESPTFYARTSVRNYSRLPVASLQVVIAWVHGEEDTSGDDWPRYLYDLGPLEPCMQFSVVNYARDALRRGASRHPDVRKYQLEITALFDDVAGQAWEGTEGAPPEHHEHTGFVSWTHVPMPVDARAEAEPIPNCSPD